jgi:hypothetical protein
VAVLIHILLTSAVAAGESSASRPARFTPGERAPGTDWRGIGWTPEPVWTLWRRENSWPYRDSNSDPSVVQSVASRYTDCLIPDPLCVQISFLKSYFELRKCGISSNLHGKMPHSPHLPYRMINIAATSREVTNSDFWNLLMFRGLIVTSTGINLRCILRRAEKTLSPKWTNSLHKISFKLWARAPCFSACTYSKQYCWLTEQETCRHGVRTTGTYRSKNATHHVFVLFLSCYKQSQQWGCANVWVGIDINVTSERS